MSIPPKPVIKASLTTARDLKDQL